MATTYPFSAIWDRIGDRFDSLAIGLSGLCLLHCIATSVLLAVMASAGGVLLNPLFHEVGLVGAMLLGAFALGRGIFLHGQFLPPAIGSLGLGIMAGALTLPHDTGEVLWTVVGVGLVAFGHQLNRRAAGGCASAACLPGEGYAPKFGRCTHTTIMSTAAPR